ncbi:MAG: hypothetical protein RLZZ427_850 [Pseudomonadota bacterium]|jgi:sucrose-6-phosphate hydrolase SacC (GH32 family)
MRPRYHYAAQSNWLSDPNGLVHHAGEWHMCYQYNPQGEDWGHMSWGHAISRDLATWEELPPALVDDDQFMIFSGSAVIDHANTAGFGKDAMVALYTGAAEGHQAQCLAWSTDNGRTWTKYAGNPVLDIGIADFRDPNVFWHEPSGRWIMVVVLSTENKARLYASADLKHWQPLSDIPGTAAPGTIWECPLLIELPVEGGGEPRWLFKVDVLHGAPGSGALYQVGTFDGTQFTADHADWLVADMGSDFYAAIAWHEPRDATGRPLWIGWMGNHAYQGRLPLQGWRGAMSLPRRLSLVRRDGRLVLRQQVEPAALQGVAQAVIEAGSLPMATALALPPRGDFTLVLDDGAGRLLMIERHAAQVLVTRRDPVSPFLDAVCRARVASDALLSLWLDVGSLEVLADDGTVAISLQHRMAGEKISARLRESVDA